MGRLPSQLQAILATRTADDLDAVAEQADRIYEVANRATGVASVQSATPTLEQQVKELSKQVASLNGRLSRTTEKGKKRDRSRNRSKKRLEEGNICFYHMRFKDKAKNSHNCVNSRRARKTRRAVVSSGKRLQPETLPLICHRRQDQNEISDRHRVGRQRFPSDAGPRTTTSQRWRAIRSKRFRYLNLRRCNDMTRFWVYAERFCGDSWWQM